MHTILQERPRSDHAAHAVQTLQPVPRLQSISPHTAPQTASPYLLASLYERLSAHLPGAHDRAEAADFLQTAVTQCASQPDGLPDDPAALLGWMQAHVEKVHGQYQAYLETRKAGAPRRYFTNRAHALHFLRNVAPTKLVDGAWLYGLCAHADNARLSDLVTTYVEELGDGQPEKNHVKLYRDLLARYGLDPVDDLPDSLYYHGLVQLALAWNAEDYLPEVIGFNLGYEQLPLHLLITAYELNELGIDPYYFTLHVTVDNADTGHAKRACMAALDAAPRIDDGGEYWRRVRIGAQLGNLGVGTIEVIQGFDIDQEVVQIFARKATAGNGAHSDFCKVAGRSVNDWLSDPDRMPEFLVALEQAQWIKRDRPVTESRFWQLLQGERGEMFGVFSPYELQVIHDWIRGKASVDGAAYDAASSPAARTRPMSFRVAERLKAARGHRAEKGMGMGVGSLDTDLAIFEERYPTLQPAEQRALLMQAMSPALHWTPVGLLATRLFLQR